MKLRIAACLPLLFASPILAAEPVTADRPGYSTGTATIRPGHFNIELGYQGSSGSHSLPLTNVRIGLTPTAELDLQWGGWNSTDGSSVAAQAIQDTVWTTVRMARQTSRMDGRLDRSSRPHSSPNKTPEKVKRQIVRLRWRRRLGPVQISGELGIPASTAHAAPAVMPAP